MCHLFKLPKGSYKEETGITAQNWTHLLNVHISISVTDEVGIVYVATGLQIGRPIFDEAEVITIRRLPFHEAVNMVITNQITEAVSVSALLFLARQLNV